MDLGAKLKGRHVLITGASSGLGAHFAELCAGCGAALTIVARRRERLDALAPRLLQAGAESVEAVECDVTDEASIEEAVGETARRCRLDVLVNNAGIAGEGAALDVSAADFDQVIATNLRGVWLASVAAARVWRETKSGGAIVNIASILSSRVAGGVAPYSASKAAVKQMTAALGLEWARYGIRVNALAPGYIETEINSEFFHSEAGQTMIRRIPMRRIGQPGDLDGAFLLLATDASSWMTGAYLPVDGGHLVSSL